VLFTATEDAVKSIAPPIVIALFLKNPELVMLMFPESLPT